MSRIAEAYVQIVPSMSGAKGALEKEFGNASGPAGDAFAGGFSSKLKKAAGPIAAAFAAAGIATYVTNGVKAASDLQGALREVVTLTGETGGAADTAFAEFQDGVAGLSRELGVAQDKLTGGLYQTLSAGVPRENAFTFLETAAKAAIAGVTDTETAVDGISSIVNAFGLSATDAEAVADSMFSAVAGGKTTFEELAASIANVAPAAAASGVSFTEINAAIATLTAGGAGTSEATTQLRAALTGLQRPSEQLDSIFQKLGYENAQLAIESEGLGFALNAVKDASGGSNGALQQLLGSSEAVAAANVLAGTGAEKFTAELERQSNALGATDDAFREVDKSRSLERLNNAMEGLSITVGTVLLPVVEGFVNAMTPVFDYLSENPAIVTAVGIALGFLAAAFVGVTIATWAMNTALLANPITWIVIGIVALIAAVVALAMNWDTVVAWISDVWDGFTKALGNGLKQIGDFFSDTWTNISNFFSDTWNNLTRAAANGWNQIVSFLRTGLEFLVNMFLNWTLLGVIIKNWDAIVSFFTNGWNGLTKFFSNGLDALVNGWRTAFEGIGNFVRDVFQNIVGFVKAPINAIIGLINGAIGAVNGLRIDIPDWVPGLGGNTLGFNIPRIPMLAEGGTITGAGKVLVGEEGPEILDLGRGASVVPLGAGGDTIQNYFSLTPADGRSLEEQAFEAAARLKGRLQTIGRR